MNDRDALLSAILAHPEEDTPRLVLADWLEEFGDEAERARAEFIRQKFPDARTLLHVPVRVGDHTVMSSEWSRQTCAMWGRGIAGDVVPASYTRCLLPTPGSEAWRAVSCDVGPGAWPTFCLSSRFRFSYPPFLMAVRHGFVSAVAMRQKAFIRHAGRIFARHPVESVCLLDDRPVPLPDGRGWVWTEERYSAGWLRPALWARLKGGELLPGDRRYDTHEEALVDLSGACVAFGRSCSAG